MSVILILVTFKVTCRLDSPMVVEYNGNSGILQTVLRSLVKASNS